MRVATLLGNVTPHCQLLSAIRWLLDNGFPERVDARVLSLAEERPAFGSSKQGYQDGSAAILCELMAANAVILATPVYEGVSAIRYRTSLSPARRGGRIETNRNNRDRWYARSFSRN